MEIKKYILAQYEQDIQYKTTQQKHVRVKNVKRLGLWRQIWRFQDLLELAADPVSTRLHSYLSGTRETIPHSLSPPCICSTGGARTVTFSPRISLCSNWSSKNTLLGVFVSSSPTALHVPRSFGCPILVLAKISS